MAIFWSFLKDKSDFRNQQNELNMHVFVTGQFEIFWNFDFFRPCFESQDLLDPLSFFLRAVRSKIKNSCPALASALPSTALARALLLAVGVKAQGYGKENQTLHRDKTLRNLVVAIIDDEVVATSTSFDIQALAVEARTYAVRHRINVPEGSAGDAEGIKKFFNLSRWSGKKRHQPW